MKVPGSAFPCQRNRGLCEKIDQEIQGAEDINLPLSCARGRESRPCKEDSMFTNLKENACYDENGSLGRLIGYSLQAPTEAGIAGILAKARKGPEYAILGFVENELVLGVLIYHFDKTKIIVDNLGVDERHRNEGIGRKLLHKIMSIENWKQLIVRADSASVEFFRKMGFVVRGIDTGTRGQEYYECELQSKTNEGH
jgi:ribosomal protein S18 acetylase RimI-like enzyme